MGCDGIEYTIMVVVVVEVVVVKTVLLVGVLISTWSC